MSKKNITSETLDIKKEIDEALRHILSIQLKAFVAQHLWGEKSYYRVISYKQPILEQALLTIKNWDFNWEKLSQRNN